MKLSFTKMHGAGNDFILFDDRAGEVPWQNHLLMAALATRRIGIGSEGIILIQKSECADFRFRFLNPDGAEAEMCGNGARCAALFAHRIGAAGRSMTMETQCGLVDAELLEGDQVRIWMTDPGERRYDLRVETEEGEFEGDFIVAGVPHFVVSVDAISEIDVARIGRLIRLHPAFAPNGTNVDFIAQRPGNRLAMRTYERGVEDESGACGTGALASAVVSVEKNGYTLPVKVKTSSGYELTIDGDWHHGRCTGLTLTGPACVVYSGVLDTDDVDFGAETD